MKNSYILIISLLIFSNSYQIQSADSADNETGVEGLPNEKEFRSVYDLYISNLKELVKLCENNEIEAFAELVRAKYETTISPSMQLLKKWYPKFIEIEQKDVLELYNEAEPLRERYEKCSSKMLEHMRHTF